MARKRKLTPIQGELLWMLEEAGAESLPCVVSTLQPADLDAFEAAVRQLVRAGLIRFYRDLQRSGLNYLPLSEEESEALPAFRQILSEEWVPERFEGIMLTEIGEAGLLE